MSYIMSDSIPSWDARAAALIGIVYAGMVSKKKENVKQKTGYQVIRSPVTG